MNAVNYTEAANKIKVLIVNNLDADSEIFVGLNAKNEFVATPDEDVLKHTLCSFDNSDYLETTACDDSGAGHTEDCECEPTDILQSMAGEQAIDSAAEDGAEEYIRYTR
jgi:hypothetical protein